MNEEERMKYLREEKEYEEYRLYHRNKQTRKESGSSGQEEMRHSRGSGKKIGDESLGETQERRESSMSKDHEEPLPQMYRHGQEEREGDSLEEQELSGEREDARICGEEVGGRSLEEQKEAVGERLAEVERELDKLLRGDCQRRCEKYSRGQPSIESRQKGRTPQGDRGKKRTPETFVWEAVKTYPETDGESGEEESQGRWEEGGRMMPLLVKGSGQVQYIPWGSQDLEGLKNTLPNLHEGAGKWIRAFEEETAGRLLAMGDLKALLIRLMGTSKFNKLMEMAGIVNSNNPRTDGDGFDRVRQRVWQALRKLYPPKVDPKALKGNPLGDTENPAAYVENQLKRWRLETEQEVENSLFITTLFRHSILDAMPPQIKSKLE